MKRRTFITLLGGAAAAWPLAARVQQSTMPVIVFLHSETLTDMPQDRVTAFRQGLREAGFIEGQNVAIEYRSAESQMDRLPLLVADLLRRQVALIVGNTPSALAAKAATTTVPIVFVTGGDPVRDGLVASLNRPGGNVTGVSWFGTLLSGKGLGLLHELVPNAAVIGLLTNPKLPESTRLTSDAEEEARTLGRTSARNIAPDLSIYTWDFAKLANGSRPPSAGSGA
jgi:ABC-type uncharacterized transport system substrate-binding protein